MKNVVKIISQSIILKQEVSVQNVIKKINKKRKGIKMRMEQHITLAGALRIGFGVLGIMIAIIVFVAVAGGGLISGDREAIAITSLVGSIVAGVLVFFSIPDIIAGIGLLKRRPWARILTLILSCIDLLGIPFGTALGAYSLWVLLNDETNKIFTNQSAKN